MRTPSRRTTAASCPGVIPLSAVGSRDRGAVHRPRRPRRPRLHGDDAHDRLCHGHDLPQPVPTGDGVEHEHGLRPDGLELLVEPLHAGGDDGRGAVARRRSCWSTRAGPTTSSAIASAATTWPRCKSPIDLLSGKGAGSGRALGRLSRCGRRPAPAAAAPGRAPVPGRLRSRLRLRDRATVIVQATLLGDIVARVFLGHRDLAAVAGAAARCSPRRRSPRGLLAWAFEAGGHLTAAATTRRAAPAARRGSRSATGAGDPRPTSGDVTTAAVDGVDALDPYFARYLPAARARRRRAGRRSSSGWRHARRRVGRHHGGDAAADPDLRDPRRPRRPSGRARARYAALGRLSAAISSTSCAACRRCARSTAAPRQADRIAETGEALPPRDDGHAADRVPLGARARARRDARHRGRRGRDRHPPRPTAASRSLRRSRCSCSRPSCTLPAAQRRRPVPRERRRDRGGRAHPRRLDALAAARRAGAPRAAPLDPRDAPVRLERRRVRLPRPRARPVLARRRR